jgi:hypothetical protein
MLSLEQAADAMLRLEQGGELRLEEAGDAEVRADW